MSLQKHYHKTYAYCSRRIDGRKTNQYLGHTPDVLQAAQAETARRQAEHDALHRFDEIERWLDKYEHTLRVLMEATLILNGYYCHKYQWRKRNKKARLALQQALAAADANAANHPPAPPASPSP